MKKTKRKGFNFFRSYYDVFNELPKEDKLVFIEALLDRQFLGIKPENLQGMAKFAWISQVNSIDSQVKGYEDKTGDILTPTEGGCLPPTEGGFNTPTLQVEEKEKEKEKYIPTLKEFLDFGRYRKKNVDLQDLTLKYESWKANGWNDGNDKPITNWQAKLINTLRYIKEDNSKKNNNPVINRNDFFTD